MQMNRPFHSISTHKKFFNQFLDHFLINHVVAKVNSTVLSDVQIKK